MLKYFLLIFGLLAGLAPVQAEIPVVRESELVPGDLQTRSTRIITHIIDTYHYKTRPLDDALSGTVLEKYLENLDQNRSFFLQSDIDEFRSKYQTMLDDSIRQASLEPAYEIFKVFRKRVRERIDYTAQLLEQDHDFSIDEEYLFDRRESPWAQTEDAIKELWRKRVKNDILNLKLAGKEMADIRETLGKRYRRIMNSTYQLNNADVFQSFINAYTTSIEPHTAYFSPRTSENFDISMRLSLEGIGAVLRGDSDYTQVQRIIPGGPADLSGQLKAEDRIIGVGQERDGEIVDVVGWRLDDVVDLIRGPKGTVLRLEILAAGVGPEGPTRIITLTRDKIKLEEQSAKSEVIEVPDTNIRIGVIDLPTFYVDFAALARGEENYRSTTRDVKKLLTELEQQDIQGVVIDLRGNGGGSLAEALDLTG
ncbi:MAG: PDZ domain-containing protein, partial [Gammaproteobacteria bacterium]|nr:PDZ domain-containing protein [Gammaproteobacteria bacterium]